MNMQKYITFSVIVVVKKKFPYFYPSSVTFLA